ncbi:MULTISPECIES: hypothetical protein [Peribacillus]|jgi:hypothetical protein|uniref:hypothetical protein n=1 Tax=Peribacillus TaxID=2675229 RepID=UPI0007BF7C34|nr:hypothetical protein [Peribacillus frigoritolerans]MCM3169455.1 hypothetical protein [Peribacillus frigoritolerans]
MENKEEIDMKTRFFNALTHFKVDYNAETGRLSDPVTIYAYKKRKYITARLFILDDAFNLMDDNTPRKISFDKVQSFKLEKDEP